MGRGRGELKMIMNCIHQRRALILFLSGTIVEGFHHHKLPSRRKQDLDLAVSETRIVE